MSMANILTEIKTKKAKRKQREDELRDKKNPWLDAAISAGLAYATGGIGTALMGAAAPAVAAIPGATQAASAVKTVADVAKPVVDTAKTVEVVKSGNVMDIIGSGIKTAGLEPTQSNVMSALQAGVKGYGSKDPVQTGLQGGLDVLETSQANRQLAEQRARTAAIAKGLDLIGEKVGPKGEITYGRPPTKAADKVKANAKKAADKAAKEAKKAAADAKKAAEKEVKEAKKAEEKRVKEEFSATQTALRDKITNLTSTVSDRKTAITEIRNLERLVKSTEFPLSMKAKLSADIRKAKQFFQKQGIKVFGKAPQPGAIKTFFGAKPGVEGF